MSEQAKTEAGRYLCFSLGTEKFAIPLLQVKEVIGDSQTTPIPQAPAYFKGILNLRGQIIPVIDLRSKMKISQGGKASETTVIILDFDALTIGVVVDSVDCVSMFEEKDLSEPPAAGTSVKLDLIKGVARGEKSLTLILDLKSILDIEDYKIIKNSTKQAA